MTAAESASIRNDAALEAIKSLDSTLDKIYALLFGLSIFILIELIALGALSISRLLALVRGKHEDGIEKPPVPGKQEKPDKKLVQFLEREGLDWKTPEPIAADFLQRTQESLARMAGEPPGTPVRASLAAFEKNLGQMASVLGDARPWNIKVAENCFQGLTSALENFSEGLAKIPVADSVPILGWIDPTFGEYAGKKLEIIKRRIAILDGLAVGFDSIGYAPERLQDAVDHAAALLRSIRQDFFAQNLDFSSAKSRLAEVVNECRRLAPSTGERPWNVEDALINLEERLTEGDTARVRVRALEDELAEKEREFDILTMPLTDLRSNQRKCLRGSNAPS